MNIFLWNSIFKKQSWEMLEVFLPSPVDLTILAGVLPVFKHFNMFAIMVLDSFSVVNLLIVVSRLARPSCLYVRFIQIRRFPLVFP